ncbi:uncharacterized protein [Periplaneta americana]|uniref:uncharacterized protein n=1 Tax=Periplaneta americana TaxID=6978 RepID=UPI0037E6F85E
MGDELRDIELQIKRLTEEKQRLERTLQELTEKRKHILQNQSLESFSSDEVSSLQDSCSSFSGRRQSYDKLISHADTKGQSFEIKMATLLFLRGVNSSQKFFLATNMSGVGQFDDLVFLHGNRTFLVQLKHKQKVKSKNNYVGVSRELLSLQGIFSIIQYCRSYPSASNWLESSGLSENSELVLFTNRVLHTNSTCPNSVLSTGGQTFLFDEDKDAEVYSLFQELELYIRVLHEEDTSSLPERIDLADVEVKTIHIKRRLQDLKQDPSRLDKEREDWRDMSYYKKFLSKLRLYSGQADENELDNYIKQELFQTFGTSGVDNDIIFEKLLKEIHNWWENESFFLTEEVYFWQNLIQSRVDSLNKAVLSKLRCHELSFIEEQTSYLKEQIFNNSVVQIVPEKTNGASVLSCLKVHQSLRHEHHLLVDYATFESRFSEILALWERGKMYNVLVVKDMANSKSLTESIKRVLQSNPHKRFVLISRNFDQVGTMLDGRVITDHFKFKQLDQMSQEKILDSEINFQGFDISLKTLVKSTTLFHTITSDIVTGIKEVKVGDKLADDDDSYIPRTLLRQEHISKGILSVKGTERVAVSEMSIHELQKLVPPGEIVEQFSICETSDLHKCRYIIINDLEDFRKLCEMFNSFHWLKNNGDNLIWMQSKGKLAFIRRHILQNVGPVMYTKVNEISKLPQNVVLVVAEPGMGKSTELSHLASELKQGNPTMWVVKVDLYDYTDHLSKDQPSTLELLLRAGKFNTEFERSLFKHEIHHDGNITVMFDGFDEISPNYAEKVITILKILAATHIKKIWVTSRPVMRENLERELSTLAYILKPFSRDDQREFLLKLWKGAHTGPHDLKNLVSSLLRVTARSLNDKQRIMTGIPLQTKMLAEAFWEDAQHYCATGEHRLPLKLDVLQLYNMFVNRKWQLYYEKNMVDITRVGLSENFQDLRDVFEQCHMSCALLTVLEHDEVRKLHNSETIMKQVQAFLTKFRTGRDKTGIVIDVINDRAIFIHRTFAEYFVALWFAENFRHVTEYLKTKIFEPNFQIVRKFFNRILAQKFTLHTAILNHDKCTVETLMSAQTLDVNVRDEGGRTPLYLAVMSLIEDDPNSVVQQIIAILLEYGANPGIKDKVFGWRPLRLADKIRTSPYIFGLLLDKKASSSDLVLARQEIPGNDMYVQDVLRIAARHGFVKLAKFVFECGIRVGHSIMVVSDNRSECCATMLHEAARYGQLRLVKYLIDHKADIEARDSSMNERTALMWAAERGQLGIVEYLIKRGSNVNACDEYGYTALLLAARNAKLDVVKLLTQHTDVMACDNEGDSILHFAARSGSVELVTYLLNIGLDSNCRNRSQQTPLWQAALYGRNQVTHLLCQKGADLYIQDTFDGYTPLHVAAEKGHLRVVQCLICHGASASALDKRGHTPLDVAVEYNNAEITEFLLKKRS